MRLSSTPQTAAERVFLCVRCRSDRLPVASGTLRGKSHAPWTRLSPSPRYLSLLTRRRPLSRATSGNLPPSRATSGNLPPSRAILDNLGQSRAISGHLGQSRVISGNLGSSRAISGHLGSSRAILTRRHPRSAARRRPQTRGRRCPRRPTCELRRAAPAAHRRWRTSS